MLDKANSLKQENKVYEANQLYTDLISRFPNSKHVTDAYVGKAEIHLEAENYVKARENYEEAIHSTEDEERRVELYEAYHRTYLTPARLDVHRKDKSSDELFIKGMLLRKEGRFLEAAEVFEEFANSSFSTEDVSSGLYWSGRCYHDKALFAKSVDAFKKLIADYEDSSYTIKTYYYLAQAYSTWAETLKDQSKSKYELAIDTVEKAKMKYENNNDSSIYGWLSRMQEIENDAREKLSILSDSTKVAEVVTTEDPKDPNVNTKQEKGNSQSNQRKTEPLKPRNQEIPKDKYYGRGLTFFDESQYAKAIGAFKNAIDIDPEFKEAHFYLGVIYIKRERHAEAIKAFEEAIRIDSNFKEAYYNLGLAHFERGERQKAKNAAENALAIDRNYEPARVLIEFVSE